MPERIKEIWLEYTEDGTYEFSTEFYYEDIEDFELDGVSTFVICRDYVYKTRNNSKKKEEKAKEELIKALYNDIELEKKIATQRIQDLRVLGKAAVKLKDTGYRKESKE